MMLLRLKYALIAALILSTIGVLLGLGFPTLSLFVFLTIVSLLLLEQSND